MEKLEKIKGERKRRRKRRGPLFMFYLFFDRSINRRRKRAKGRIKKDMKEERKVFPLLPVIRKVFHRTEMYEMCAIGALIYVYFWFRVPSETFSEKKGKKICRHNF
jgi:hypothetical protein